MNFDDLLDCYLHALGGEKRATSCGELERVETWQQIQAIYARLLRDSLVTQG